MSARSEGRDVMPSAPSRSSLVTCSLLLAIPTSAFGPSFLHLAHLVLEFGYVGMNPLYSCLQGLEMTELVLSLGESI